MSAKGDMNESCRGLIRVELTSASDGAPPHTLRLLELSPPLLSRWALPGQAASCSSATSRANDLAADQIKEEEERRPSCRVFHLGGGGGGGGHTSGPVLLEKHGERLNGGEMATILLRDAPEVGGRRCLGDTHMAEASELRQRQ